MREIKFRAFALGRMFENILLGFNYGIRYKETIGNIIFTAESKAVYTDKKGYTTFGTCNLMQFTGAKDRNGVDIYEGDIIEFDLNEWGGEDNIHTVTWDAYNCAWCFGGGSAQSDMQFRTVIGNIHENPELLK